MNNHMRSHIYLFLAVCTVTSATWYIHTVSQEVNRELEGFAAYHAHLEIPVGEPHDVSL